MAVNINVPSQVKTYADLAAFPASGALKTIYIAEDTNKTYRWTGSVYVEVSAAGASGITIGTTAITSGTVGRVLFEGTGNVVQESANLFWDNTNGALELATSADAIVGIRARSTTGQLKLRPYLNPTFGVLAESRNAADSAYLPFTISGSRILLADGNVLIGTTTDAGYRLDVNGTARFGATTFPNATNINGSGNLSIGPFTLHGGLGFASFSQTTLLLTGATFTSTSGNQIGLSFSGGFAPTSGTATYSSYSIIPTINQTGGANGITRGLFINPTLTAAADFRAIETTNGKVIFGNLPTSSAGLPTGAIWNDAGTLKIV